MIERTIEVTEIIKTTMVKVVVALVISQVNSISVSLNTKVTIKVLSKRINIKNLEYTISSAKKLKTTFTNPSSFLAVL